jgi:glycosyltransferase involved in cell wall biosynthesis
MEKNIRGEIQMKLCFVVHRYAPFPGGSEYYVQQMAEESLSRGHEVTVVSGEHKGDLNGVKVSSDVKMLFGQDLIIVHGGDVGVQNNILLSAKRLSDLNIPILYMLIKPSESFVCLKALEDVKYIGCSAPEDWEHVKKFGFEKKSHKVIHGISPKDCIGTKGQFRDKYNIPKNKRMFLSCGGYWPNKRMIELSEAFTQANLENSILVTTGYDNRFNIMPHQSDIVIPLMVDDPKDVKNAIADADCYIMNSDAEGFGLVILESMINRTPWISRNIAGAKLLSKFGTVYDTEQELVNILRTWKSGNNEDAYNYVMENHLIKNTINDIEKLHYVSNRII